MKISLTPSLMAINQLQRTTNAISKAMERLSTGKRVNHAADDSVTLSRDATLDAQVRGLRQGIQNANQAIGMLSTAEGAISTQIELVTRMRELTLQAANGTLTSSDRTNLNQEISQLYAEFQRITNTTEYNGQYLLNGSMGKVGLQIGDKPESGMDQIFMDISNLDASKVFLQTVGDGQFTAQTATRALDSTAAQINSTDLNGDGKRDLIVRDSAGVGTYLGLGDGTFGTRNTVTNSSVTGFDIGDFNGDGKIDIVTFSTTNISVYQGKADGTFEIPTTTTTTGTTKAIAVGDLNNDGKIDLITSYNVSANFYLQPLFGTGQGTFTLGTSVSTGSSIVGTFLKLGDINNDGNLDIAYRSGTGTAAVVNGVGDGSFSAASAQSLTITGTTFQDMAFGDVNGDGNLDLVLLETQLAVGGKVATALNNGSGSLSVGTASFVGTSTSPTLTGLQLLDFNGDGYLDVSAVSATDATISTLIGQGNGEWNTQRTYSTGSNPRGSTVGDFNGDGITDLISMNQTAKTASVYLGNSIQSYNTQAIDVSTQTKAQNLLKILDNAVDGLRAEQVRIGALHERLDSSSSNNLLISDSIDEARQNAMSSDLAIETADLVRQQILQQAQVAVLAQANVQMQIVLNLLKPLSSSQSTTY